MDEFSFIFELFALLLGLAVAEMLGGFGQVLKLRTRRKAGLAAGNETRVGWLVPLLGLLVLVDLATFWSGIWSARNGLDMTMLTVFCVLALIGGYYLVATQVFPDDPALWPDFDAWYRLQKRFVVLGMFVINLLAQSALALLGAVPTATVEQVVSNPLYVLASVLTILAFPAFLWLAFSKREKVDVALMLFIVASQFFYAWAALGIEGIE
jgi:hypothetical protein